MAEPTTTTSTLIGAGLVAAVAPAFGDYAVIIVSALAGSMWPLSTRQDSRASGAAFVFRMVITSAALTGFVVWILESKAGVPTGKALAPAAFIIAAIGDQWRSILSSGVKRIKSLIQGTGDAK